MLKPWANISILPGVQMRRDRLVVQRALTGVRCQHHDHVRFLARVRRRQHAQPLGLRGGATAARLGEPDPDVVPGVAQVERVGVALRAVAEHGDGAARQSLWIGVCVVVHPSGH